MINEILTKFYEASYSISLNLLSNYEPIFGLDIYLDSDLKKCLCDIRHRMIIIYFSPYKNVRMTTMAQHLNMTLEKLEDELVPLIRQGKLQAKIDSKNKILHLADTDQRWLAYHNALQVTQRTKTITQAALLRTAIIRGNFSVKSSSDETFRKFMNQNESLQRLHSQQRYEQMMSNDGNTSDDGLIN